MQRLLHPAISTSRIAVGNSTGWVSDLPQQMRLPGVEPGAQAWEACMLPLHYRRPCKCDRDAPHATSSVQRHISRRHREPVRPMTAGAWGAVGPQAFSFPGACRPPSALAAWSSGMTPGQPQTSLLASGMPAMLPCHISLGLRNGRRDDLELLAGG